MTAVADDLRAWCLEVLGSEVGYAIFEAGHLSRVVAVGLADGREVVVKIRPDDPRLRDRFVVQVELHAKGFPCPRPLVGPTRFGELMASVEEHVPGGVRMDVEEGLSTCAALLARFVELAPPAEAVPSLLVAPPWVGWDHRSPETWPPPDDLHLDLNLHPGPGWIDDAGQRLRERLTATESPPVVGHLDWESHNLRWTEAGQPLCVDDWDSVGAVPEPAVAGAAAAVHPAAPDGRVVMATVDQSERFLAAYCAARGFDWSDDERQIAWAAGAWVLTYNAKKEANGGGRGYLQPLVREIAERLRRAGCGASA